MPLFVKPNPNKKTVDGEAIRVFDPERRGWLPADGGAVPSNAYWVRRIADGDCVEYTPGAAAAPAVDDAAAKKAAAAKAKEDAKAEAAAKKAAAAAAKKTAK